MHTYSLGSTRLSSIQLDVNTPEYRTFNQRFSHGLDEWVTVFDEQVIERAYLRLNGGCANNELNLYKSILSVTCGNTDGDVYWTWVFYDIVREVHLVTIQDMMDAYEECRNNFSFAIIITRENIRDEDSKWLVDTFTRKVKEIRNRKINQIHDAWIMETVHYTNMVQWVPRELIEDFTYALLVCSV